MLQGLSRIGRCLGLPAALALTALAGCQTTTGESGVDAELARLQVVKGYGVVSSAPHRAVFALKGERMVVEPPEGYCLDAKSVRVIRETAFVLVADCLEDRRSEVDAQAAASGGTAPVLAISLPRSFPGILTVSISGASAYGQSPRALDEFEELVASESGRKLLGRGNGIEPGKIIATRRIGGALYVLIEESRPDGVGLLAPRFWRAFHEIRQRLALVTVSSFSDRPVAEDAMLSFLARQMGRLRQANGMPVEPEEAEIASQLEASLGEAPTHEGDMTIIRSENRVVLSDGIDPTRAPLPPERRVASVTIPATAPGPLAPSGGPAPNYAPLAPVRPG